MDKLINYYLLCSAGSGKVPHVADELSSEQLTQILSKKEQREYLRRVDGKLIAAETIIGGQQNGQSADVIDVRPRTGGSLAAPSEKIIVFY